MVETQRRRGPVLGYVAQLKHSEGLRKKMSKQSLAVAAQLYFKVAPTTPAFHSSFL